MQYAVIRLKAQVSIPQTLTILIISRAISIVIAWTIWMFYPKGIPHMYSEFIFVPAVISELLLQGINFFTLQYFIKKNG